MKKIIFVIFICALILVGCKTTTYTTEFPFLPSHPNMEFVEIIHQPKEENEYTTATYIVRDSTQEQVIEEYLKILKKDTWNITFVNEPILIQATKDNNDIYIFINQIDNDVSLAILVR